jgi:hypothetical protein
MKLYLNTSTGLLTTAANGTTGIRRLDAKRGDLLELEVVPSAEITGATGILAAKEKGAYSGAAVALDSAWTAPETEGAGYLFSLSLNTEEIAALFTGEKAEVVLMAEITWTFGSVTRSSQTFDLVVARDVWQGDEGAPSPVTPLRSFDIESVTGLTRWRITIDDDGVILRTALALMALCAFSAGAMGQTVRDLTTTNGTLQGTGLRINTATNFNFGGVGGSLQVEAQGGNHAIAARASDEADGAAFYGWSESGAPAMKMVQSNNFNSPALTVWRTGTSGTNGYSNSPTVLIAGSPTNTTAKALSIQNGVGEVFWVKYDGTTSITGGSTNVAWAGGLTNSTYGERLVFDNAAGRLTYFAAQTNDPVILLTSAASSVMLGLRGTNAFLQSGGNLRIEGIGGGLAALQIASLITSGGQTNSLPAVNAPLVPWLGNSTTNPAATVEGAMYFNTTNSTIRIYANGSWRALN